MADLSGIDSAAADGVSVAVEGREIVVNGDYRGYVGVFDMSGKVYYSGEAVLPLRVSVDGGVYAVKYDGSLVKVIVK
jgi:formylmethanofuran dehydrogenase subunit C